MIASYIIGIIMFVFQVYILKHTHSVELIGEKFKDKYNDNLKPLDIPLYIILLMLIATAIPYAWIISTVVFWVVWCKKYSDPDGVYTYNIYTYWRLKDNFLMKSI